MKDSLTTLFHDRFQGHELPVDPGVWQGITQQIANVAGASAMDGVSDLFKERFQGHETAVDPAVWQGISAQLGHAVVGTTTGSGFLGWAAAGVLAVTIGTVAYFTLGERKTTTISAVASTPTEQVAPILTPEAPVSELVRTTREPASQEPKASRPVTTHVRQIPASIEPSTGPVAIEPPPALAASPSSGAQPLPTQKGAAVVESIIAGITTEVKQQVREEQVRTQTPDASLTTPDQDGAVRQPEVATMPELFVPNTFTPNGDGKNDEYQIGSEGFSEVLIRVYSVKDNRLVFSSTNSQEKWLGTNCEDGMYLVAVEARTPDGRTTTEGKVVWLNRNQMN